MEGIIENSDIHNTAKLFKYCTVVNSNLEKSATVGDFSRVTSSTMNVFSRLDRFSLLYHSILGDYSYTGPYDMIMHSEIGKFCSISWGVTIGPGDHDFNRISTHDFLYNNHYGLIPESKTDPTNRFGKTSKINNDVWVGANVTILRGVTVGNGAVIGANSVVNKDVPPYAIVAGVPAKVIKYRFDEDIIDELQDIEWWNFPSTSIKEVYDAFTNYNIKEALKILRQNKG